MELPVESKASLRARSLKAVCLFALASAGACSDHKLPTQVSPGGLPPGFAQAANPGPGDDWESIQACVDQAASEIEKTCYLPAGDWEVGTQPVKLKSGVRVAGDGDATKIKLESDEWQGAIFVADSVSNVTVERLRFVGRARKHQFGLLVLESSNVTFQDNSADKIGLIGATVHEPKDTRRTQYQNSSLTVLRNRGIGPCGQGLECLGGSGADNMIEAIWLEYTQGATVEYNNVSNYNFGIQWWGGNASKERGVSYAKDYVIRYNRVDKVFGGIWGSNGTNITVEHDTVTNCKDVCIDDEGGTNVRIAHNVVKFGTYPLASFYGSPSVTFFDNTVEKSDTYTDMNNVQGVPVGSYALFYLHNEPRWENANVIVDSNRFTWSGPTNLVGVVEKEFSHTFRFVNNQMYDVVLDLARVKDENHGAVEVFGNKLHFRRSVPDNRPVVRVRANTISPDTNAYEHNQAPAIFEDYQVRIENNTFSSEAAQSSGVAVIDVWQGTYCGCSVKTLIRGNYVRDSFVTAIRVENQSSNNFFDITANAVGGKAILIDSSVVNAPRFYKTAFRTYTGNYFKAHNGGGGSLTADGTQKGQWETFYLVDLNGGALSTGDKVHVQTAFSEPAYFMVAEGGGGSGSEVNATRTAALQWETFTIVRADGSADAIGSGTQIALRTYNDVNYIQAWGGGGGGLNGEGAGIGNWETFTLEYLP